MTTQRAKRQEKRYGLTSGDVVKLLYALESRRLSFDRLYYYEKTGLVVPSIKSSNGRGIKRLYSAEDLIILSWLLHFDKNGISLRRFRSVIDYLKLKMPEILAEPHKWQLTIKAKDVKFVNKETGKKIEIINESAQYHFVFRSFSIANSSISDTR